MQNQVLCAHGCGEISTHVNKQGTPTCKKSSNQCLAIRERNSQGVKKAHAGKDYGFLKGRTNWNPWNKGLIFAEFEYDGRGNHKSVLIKERGYKCEGCFLSEWLGQEIVLELDHIDGNNKNNIRENLRLLCPNCHSQTPTWRGRGVNGGAHKASDEQIIELIMTGINNRQVLINLGMAAKGGNYSRVNKLRARVVQSVEATALNTVE